MKLRAEMIEGCRLSCSGNLLSKPYDIIYPKTYISSKVASELLYLLKMIFPLVFNVTNVSLVVNLSWRGFSISIGVLLELL